MREFPDGDLIDIHAHFFTEDYLAAMRGAGMRDVDGYPLPEWNIRDALDMMDQCGIQAAALSISAPGIVFVEGAAAITLARRVNDAHADLIARFPTRFGGFAVLPLPDVDAALHEMEHALDELGLDGIVLYSNIDGIYPGDPRFDPLFAELNRRRGVVFIHPVVAPDFRISRLGIHAAAVEFPFDTTRTIMNLIATGTIRRYPNVRIIVAHGGGTLPFLGDRIGRNLARFSANLVGASPQDVEADFQSLYYDLTSVMQRYALDSVLTVARADRLLFGSDFPFISFDHVKPAVAFFDGHSRLDEVMRRAAKSGTALKLLPRLASRLGAR